MVQRRSRWLLQLDTKRVLVRMVIGAILGLLFISSIVFTVDDPDPAWGRFWMVRPLIITPIASAFGMLSFFLKEYIRPDSAITRLLVLLISLIGFFVALWLGTVLGLDGTLWN